MLNPQLFNQNSNISNDLPPISLEQISLLKDAHYPFPIPAQKLINACFYISSLNMSRDAKDKLITNVLKKPYVKHKGNDSNLSSNNLNNTPQKTNDKISAGSKNQRVLFTKEEDDRIKQLVDKFGTNHWNLIALCMERRTAKQCRDRYHNYLMPGCFQGEWTKEEDNLLSQLYDKFGPKWSIIKKSFPNRGYNNIKSRWHFFISKQNLE